MEAKKGETYFGVKCFDSCCDTFQDMSDTADYISVLDALDPDDRMNFMAEAIRIMESEDLDATNADLWEAVGRQFADRARAMPDQNKSIVVVALAASMFEQAERLREPKQVS